MNTLIAAFFTFVACFIVLPMVFLMVMTLWALVLGATNAANPALLRVLSCALILLAVAVIGLSLRPLLTPTPLREEIPASAEAAAPF